MSTKPRSPGKDNDARSGPRHTAPLVAAASTSPANASREGPRRERIRAASIVQSATDLVWAMDRSGRMRYANLSAQSAFRDLLGIELGFDRPLASILPAPLGDQVAMATRAAVSGERVVAEHPFGTLTDAAVYQVVYTPIRRGRRTIGVAAVGRDLTERRSLDEQMRLGDRLACLGSLAGGVAHELNNPLAAMALNLESLALDPNLRKNPAFGPVLAIVNEMTTTVERMATTVRELRAFGQEPDIDSNGMIDVARCIRSAANLARHVVRHRATFQQDIPEFLPAVMGNETQLTQSLVSLLINAAESFVDPNPSDQEVMLAATATPTELFVDIRDSGSGIPETVLPHIFEPFFSTKPLGHGTGMSLSIVHRAVAMMGGRVEVDTEVGKGTTFRIVLQRANHVRKTALPAPRCGLHILVVDDEALVVRSVERLLRGHHVARAYGGTQAVSLIESANFDAILCDLLMPDLDGMTLYSLVEARFPRVAERFVFMTGGAVTSEARNFVSSVERPCLFKPFSAKDLETALANVVGSTKALAIVTPAADPA